MIEVSAPRSRERLEERRHTVLPFLIPDHGQPFDIGKMFHVKLDVLPHGAAFPAMEIAHVKKHAKFPMSLEESLELRHKLLVICLHQLPADVHGQAPRRHCLG